MPHHIVFDAIFVCNYKTFSYVPSANYQNSGIVLPTIYVI